VKRRSAGRRQGKLGSDLILFDRSEPDEALCAGWAAYPGGCSAAVSAVPQAGRRQHAMPVCFSWLSFTRASLWGAGSCRGRRSLRGFWLQQG